MRCKLWKVNGLRGLYSSPRTRVEVMSYPTLSTTPGEEGGVASPPGVGIGGWGNSSQVLKYRPITASSTGAQKTKVHLIT